MSAASKEALVVPPLVRNENALKRATSHLGLRSKRPPHITALGGGSGLSVVLRGLRAHHLGSKCGEPPELTAIVTVADDGGSTGVLRKALNIQAVGDIRSSLLALSDGDPTLQALFNFRFDNRLESHSLGNLILAALTLREKDFGGAIKRANKLLSVQGQVVPATTGSVELLAEFDDGGMLKGESGITAAGRRIRHISLLPADVQASPAAVSAIANSDLVVIGPGSLYTSLLPNLLLPKIRQAIMESRAHVVLVMNLMTEPGETQGYTAADIAGVLRQHAPGLPLHTVLANDAAIPDASLKRYAARNVDPIRIDADRLEAMGAALKSCKLLARGQKIRHDSRKLARALLSVVQDAAPAGQRYNVPGDGEETAPL